MRIESGVTTRYIYFVGVDATDFTTRETGLSSFTVYRSRNGGASAAMTTPTINETDSANMPGVYELLLDEDMTIDSGDDSQEMVFHITHSGMAPVTRTIELYRPKITAGNTLDVTSTGAAGIDWGNVENASTSVDLSATAINLCDTVTTNTDMRGTDSAYTGTPPTASAIADAVLDEALSGHTTAGTLGKAVADTETDATSILADTNELQGDWADGGRLDLILDARASQTSVDTVDSNVDAILVDTGTDIPARFDGIEGATFSTSTDSLEAIRNRGDAAWTTGVGGGGGDATSANQTTIINHLTDIKGVTWDSSNSLEAIHDDLAVTDGVADGIKAVTDNLPDSGALTSIAQASALATVDTNVDAVLVDTGTTIPAQITALNDLSQADVRTAVGLASANLDTQIGALPTAAENRAEMDSNSTQLAAIVADTNELQTDDIPATLATLATASALATVDSNVGAVLVDTGTTIPAQISGLNDPTATAIADAILDEALSGHTTAGTVGEAMNDMVDGIITGSATAGTLSTTQASTDLTGYADDQLIGRVVIWLTGNAAGEATDITDYVSTNGVLTFTALTAAPSASDTFKIV